MKKAATLIALVVAVPLLMGTAGRGCSGSNSGPGGGPQVTSVPASASGKCEVGLTVTHALGEVIGGMAFTCTGAAVLTVNIYLLYKDPAGDGSFDQQAEKRAVSSVLEISPVTLSARCRTGKWKLRVKGDEMGVGATIPVDQSSDPVYVVC